MAAFDSSVAIDQSELNAAQDAIVEAVAKAKAEADAGTVEGVAEGSAVTTRAAGVLNSGLTFGTEAEINVTQEGDVDAKSTTVGKTNEIGSVATTSFEAASSTYTAAGHDLHSGDRLLIPAEAGGLIERFVVNVSADQSTFQLALDPAGERIDDNDLGLSLSSEQTERVASTAFAGFTGNSLDPISGAQPTGTGGMIDSSDATDVDLTVGTSLRELNVDAANTADAVAENTSGDAYSTSRIQETFGLSQIGINVGLDSSPLINVDADVSATAQTIGDPLTEAPGAGAGADAVADADASRVIAINDLGDSAGDFSFGQNLNLVAKAGSSTDQVTIKAQAETETGEAIADAETISVSGIRDDQDGITATSANQLTIGANGDIQTGANAALEALARSTTGTSTARSLASEINGIHADDVSAGGSLNLEGDAESSMIVSANVVDGITADTGIADASGTIAETKGISLERLNIGDQPVSGDGSDNVQGRATSQIDVSASSDGADSVGDRANARATINDAAGVELGAKGDQAALAAGGASRLNGQVDLNVSANASSTHGDVDALSLVGDGVDGEVTQGAIGVEFNNDAMIGPGGAINASAKVGLDAQASNVGAYGDSTTTPTSEADAGADYVAGISATGTNGDINFADNANYNVTSNVIANAEAQSVSGHSVSAEAGATTNDSTDSGNNLAPTESMQVYGLHTENQLISGGSTNLKAAAQIDLNAEARSAGVAGESSDVSAKAILKRGAGLDSDSSTGQIAIGDDATIEASSVVTGNAEASSTEAKVVAKSIVNDNDGANTNITQIGSDAAITADATSTQIAKAKTVALDAVATSKSEKNIGFDSDGDTTIGESLQLNSISVVTNRSEAVSIDEDARALSETQEAIGIDSSALLAVGTEAEIRGQTGLVNQATATTVGNGTIDGEDGSEEDSAIAEALTTTNTGFRADDATTSVGTDGLVIATAENNNQVSATATDGQADADIAIGESLGLDLGTQHLSFGQSGQVKGSSTATNRADAVTTNGDSDADISVNTAHGIGAGGGNLSIGADGVIDADVDYANTAVSTSTDGNDEGIDGVTQATINNDSVHGIDLQTLQIGNELGLDVDVRSQQSASASTIGDPTLSSSTEAKAVAMVAEKDDISGIDTTQILVGSSTKQFTASVTLDGEAVANNKADAAFASAGDQSDVTAMDSGGTPGLVVGASAINGMAFSATSNLRSTALSVEDQSKAIVGSDSFTSQLDSISNGSSIANINMTDGSSTIPANATESSVTGIRSTSIEIGDSVYLEDANGNRVIQTIRSDVNSELSATSQTTGSGQGSQDASALISQNADGLTDSDVSIGRDGNFNAVSKVQANSLASNVGDVDSSNNSYARLQLASDGIDQSNGEQISIGREGNVVGQGWVSGSAIAETINGSSEVHGDLDAYGLNLQSDSSDVVIGDKGDISGLAVVGTLNQAGQYSDQINLVATTTSESALVLSDLDAAGIRGSDTGDQGVINPAGTDQTLLQAGATDGDVKGQVLGGVRATAATIGDPEHTGQGSSGDNAVIEMDGTLSGLRDVDILGAFFAVDANGDALSPAPFVKGTAYGDYDATSTSVKGDALAHSDVNAYGIFDENLNGTITTSGGVSAIAQISNTVLSTTVNGQADATAITDAIGIHGYQITMNDPGIFTATADSESIATSTSVLGRANA